MNESHAWIESDVRTDEYPKVSLERCSVCGVYRRYLVPQGIAVPLYPYVHYVSKLKMRMDGGPKIQLHPIPSGISCDEEVVRKVLED